MLKRLALASVSVLAVMSSAAQAQDQSAAPAAAAQTDENSGPQNNNGIADIVVTATRQATNLQSTPIAITAITSQGLEQRGLTRVQDLSFVTPNVLLLKAQSAFGPGVTTTIRGISTTDTSLGGESSVAYYIDDLYYPILLGSNFDLLDLDHVEVLRGPQGTLFGRNSLAGAINIVSKQPDPSKASAYTEITVGDYNRVDVRAGFNMPLADNAAIMVSGVSKKRTGYEDMLDFRCQMIRNGTPQLAGTFPFANTLLQQTPNFTPSNCVVGHLGGEDVRAVRGSLLWEPLSNVKLTLTGDYTKDTSENPADYVVNIDPTRVAANVAAEASYFGITLDQRFQTNNPFATYTSYSDRIGAGTVVLLPGDPTGAKSYYNGMVTRGGTSLSPRLNLINWGVSGKLQVGLTPEINLTAVAGYREMDDTHAFDTDGTPLVVEHTWANINEKYFNGEVRLAGKFPWADWVAGAFYFDAKGYNHAVDIGPTTNIQKVQYTTYDPNSKAVFANATVRPFGGDRISFVLGGRYSWDKKPVHYSNLTDITPNPQDLVFYVNPQANEFSWKAGVNFQATPTMLFYASASTGFQAPGFNARPLQPDQVQQYDASKDVAYELGSKLDLFDRHMRVNLAGFYTNFSNRPTGVAGSEAKIGTDGKPIAGNQQLIPLPGGPAGSTLCSSVLLPGPTGITCIGRTYYENLPAKIWGFEGEFELSPVRNLNINANIGYTHFTSPDISARSVNVRPFDPYWSAGAGIQYRADAPQIGGTVTPRLDWSFRSSRVSSATTTKYNYLTPAYSVFNARITYDNLDHDFSLAFGVTNLFNKLYYYNVFDYQGLSYPQTDAQPAPPRQWYLTLTKHF